MILMALILFSDLRVPVLKGYTEQMDFVISFYRNNANFAGTAVHRRAVDKTTSALSGCTTACFKGASCGCFKRNSPK
jgi:hypothetical protein